MNSSLFYKGGYGLERETLRVDINGRLAQTPHPFGDDESITRDFCENQIEVITPVCKSIDEVMSELGRLDRIVREKLKENGERIWLYSNPPHFDNEDEIPVANFVGRHSGKRKYREQLEKRYGKKLMLFSGVHFNFSFDEEYLKSICDDEDYDKWRDEFYLRLYKQLSVHSWLMLLLTAASPNCDESLFKDGGHGVRKSKYTSIRSSEAGYWNKSLPILRFESLDEFIKSIEEYVKKGILFSSSELYLPVRLKPKGVNSLDSFKNGVSHIELRMFDLDPDTPLGVDEKNIEFAHLLIMYLSTLPDFEFDEQLQINAARNHKNAALDDLSGIEVDGVPMLQRATEILEQMAAFFEGDEQALDIIKYQNNKLKNRNTDRQKKEDLAG
ncbi:MAG: glutathione synthase [Ruminococcus sp.]|nr:glutathione synthase [Ruminococcus sp.]